MQTTSSRCSRCGGILMGTVCPSCNSYQPKGFPKASKKKLISFAGFGTFFVLVLIAELMRMYGGQ